MRKPLQIGIGVIVVMAIGLFLWWLTADNQNEGLVTAEVERGTVREIISVSGFVEADNTANLTFPTVGRISGIYVAEGDFVEAGTLLATIGQDRLSAERRLAQANLLKAEAARTELLNGQTTEERAVTDATLAQARAAWEQTVATELQKIQNAQIALRSTDLEAFSTDPEEDATAPVVSGSYTCSEEGQYTLEIYRSSTDSGYSYRYTGLESGTGNVTVEQPAPLGDCGLSLLFTDKNEYAYSEWTITIPNTRSATYLSRASTLTLTEQQAAQNIQAAKDALALAENTATKDTAAPRVEALLSANASVAAAQAELARIDALLGDNSIFAPFAGTITDIDKLAGEIATTDPFITLLAEDAFSLRARIPEIDITKIEAGLTTDAVFDAKADRPFAGHVEYISPLATEIDGVAYFEAKIVLDETPDWIRSGLNADIDIIIEKRTDVLRLPKRFIMIDNNNSYIYLPGEKEPIRTEVEIGFAGNDGYLEVINVTEGTTVVAP